MFRFLLKEKVIQTIVDKITSEVNTSLNKIESSHDQKFDKILSHLESLRFEVSSIEKRLELKEIKDNVNYGQLKYQVNAIESKLRPKEKPVQTKSH